MFGDVFNGLGVSIVCSESFFDSELISLNPLQTLLNFTSSVRQARDGTYGSMKPDGTWGGMVGEVKNQEHDLGMYVQHHS